MSTTRLLKITTASSGIDYSSSSVKALVDAIDALQALVPLSSMSLVAVVGSPNVYNYNFTAVDARTWKQVIDFNQVGGGLSHDPTMTFTVNVGWKLSEFLPHRDLRAAVVDLVSNNNVIGITYTVT